MEVPCFCMPCPLREQPPQRQSSEELHFSN